MLVRQIVMRQRMVVIADKRRAVRVIDVDGGVKAIAITPQDQHARVGEGEEVPGQLVGRFQGVSPHARVWRSPRLKPRCRQALSNPRIFLSR